MAHGEITLDLVLMTSDHESIATAAAQAQRAEERGFSLVATGETTGWNIVPLLTVIAERTTTITVADDVLSPYSRAPTVLAQTALTMHDVSDRRFRLGLGTSSPALAEGWHGCAFERPLRRLRETVDIIRAVYRGGDVDYEGDVFEIGGMGYDRSVPDKPPAIDIAALGPKTVELAGRFGDGWVPQLFTREGLRERLSDFTRGANLGGQNVDCLRVSPIVRCFADDDPARARSQMREFLAFLIGAYGPFYGNSIAEQGYKGIVEEIRAAWEEQNTDAMAAALPDELLDTVAAAGSPDAVRSRVKAFAAIDGVDAVRIGFASGMNQSDKIRTLDALAPLMHRENEPS